jgi:hypothetical protein
MDDAGQSVQQWHARLLLVLGAPWLLTACTGLLYWGLTFGSFVAHDSAWLKWTMKLHQLSLWAPLKLSYAPIIGFGLVVQTLLGTVLLWRRVVRHGGLSGLWSATGVRRWHVLVALASALAVALQALSGALYRFDKSVLGDPQSATFWISLHSGAYFGVAVWPALVGCALLALLATGAMLSQWWRRLRGRFSAKG